MYSTLGYIYVYHCTVRFIEILIYLRSVQGVLNTVNLLSHYVAQQLTWKGDRLHTVCLHSACMECT